MRSICSNHPRVRMTAPLTRKARLPRTAFTLIELLVVVAIIALLMAILLPSLATARKNAQSVQCAARLRSIGGLLQIYASENSAMIPVSQNTISPKGIPLQMAWYSWFIGQSFDGSYKSPEPYIQPSAAWKLFVCPTQNADHFPKDAINTASVNAKAYFSYGMIYNSGYLAGVDTTRWLVRDASGNRATQKTTMVDAPGAIPVVVDTVTLYTAYPGNQWISFKPDDPNGATNGSYSGVHFRHQSKANILCYDGHAEALTTSAGRTMGLKCMVGEDSSLLP